MFWTIESWIVFMFFTIFFSILILYSYYPHLIFISSSSYPGLITSCSSVQETSYFYPIIQLWEKIQLLLHSGFCLCFVRWISGMKRENLQHWDAKHLDIDNLLWPTYRKIFFINSSLFKSRKSSCVYIHTEYWDIKSIPDFKVESPFFLRWTFNFKETLTSLR